MSKGLWFVVIVCLSLAPRVQADRPPVMWYSLDWDDNIFLMPTQVMVWDKVHRVEKPISTARFALVRQQMGKPGEWKDFEFRESLQSGSLRYFGDESERGKTFVQDVKAALDAPSGDWKGPSWDAFVRAMSKPETANRTTIITARLHSPHSIWEGMRELQRRGLIRYLPAEPPEDPARLDVAKLRVFPVAYPKMVKEFYGPAASPSAAKAAVMQMLLDRLNKEPIPDDAKPVTDREGQGMRRMHLWGFSDDDFGNFQKAVDVLSKGVAQGRWDNVKIVVFFTGKNHPTEKPRSVILTRKGPRAPLPPERGEPALTPAASPASPAR